MGDNGPARGLAREHGKEAGTLSPVHAARPVPSWEVPARRICYKQVYLVLNG